MKTVAIINHKGGVAKTTTAAALASGLQLRGYKVLAIDLDAQSNLTYSYGIDAKEVEYSAVDLLTDKDTNNTICHTEQGDLIPAEDALSRVLAASTGCENYILIESDALKNALKPLANKYDYCIIDTPPALTILTTNALVAADTVIMPANADIFSVQGVYKLAAEVETTKEFANPNLTISGILFTQHNARTTAAKDAVAFTKEVAKALNIKVYDATIRKAVVMQEAQVSQTSIFDYAPNSKVAQDYAQFIDEFLKGANN